MASHAARVTQRRGGRKPSLFDAVSDEDETIVFEPEAPPVPAAPPSFSSGEKGKARDVLAAIRTLQTIEREQRPATSDEQVVLAKFPGFGPVALGLFPDPVTGQFKDTGWQVLGDELKSLLTSEEYASAKWTTFNAFYTSPTVNAAIHDATALPATDGNELNYRTRPERDGTSAWHGSAGRIPIRCFRSSPPPCAKS